MAYLSIDKNRIELTVKVGILENYKPDKEIKELFEEVESLKKKLRSAKSRIIGKSKDNNHALQILQKDKAKTEKWQKYLNNTYAKQLQEVQKKIDNKNLKICPNYKDVMDKVS
tara:strand:- start:4595 stop:4933 length:339 start_codon:yes stop_codon:yes gene_type:complete